MHVPTPWFGWFMQYFSLHFPSVTILSFILMLFFLLCCFFQVGRGVILSAATCRAAVPSSHPTWWRSSDDGNSMKHRRRRHTFSSRTVHPWLPNRPNSAAEAEETGDRLRSTSKPTTSSRCLPPRSAPVIATTTTGLNRLICPIISSNRWKRSRARLLYNSLLQLPQIIRQTW